MGEWPEAVQRVAAVLRERAVDGRVEEFTRGTATAREAAHALGCEAAQVVKSVLFVCDGSPVLVLVPGDRRADVEKITAASQARAVRMARPEEVVASTGFSPGAVAPFPLANPARVLVDASLFAHEIVWVGAGSPAHMAGLAPLDLAQITSAVPADLAES